MQGLIGRMDLLSRNLPAPARILFLAAGEAAAPVLSEPRDLLLPGVRVERVAGAWEMLEAGDEPSSVCVVADADARGAGLAAVRELAASGLQAPVVLLGAGGREERLQALSAGAAEYLPLDRVTPERLREVLEEACCRREGGSRTRPELVPPGAAHERRPSRARYAADLEAALRAANHSFHYLVENSPFGVYAVDADFRLVLVSAGAQKVFRNVRPLLGRDFAEVLRTIWPEPFASEAIRLFRRTLETGQSYHSPRTTEQRSDIGDLESYDWKLDRVTLPDGRFGVVCHFYDLSERQHYEAALRESEERFRAVFHAAGIGVAMVGMDGCIVEGNPALAEMLGCRPEDLKGRHFREFTHPQDRGEDEALFAEMAEGRRASYQVEKRYLRQDGTSFTGHMTASIMRDGGGAPVGAVRTVEDVTAHREVVAALALRNSAIEALPVAVIITDAATPEARILYVNPGFTRITGYPADEVLGRTVSLLGGPDTDPITASALERAVAAGVEMQCELLNYRKDGSAFWNALLLSPIRDETGRLTHFVRVQQDVSERRSLEEQLRQAQKMEAIGRLAGGVAHDFNNMLAVINGYASLLLPRVQDPSVVTGLTEIAKAGDRAATLTRQLLAFSRKQVLAPRLLHLPAVVADLETMLHRLIGEDIRLEVEADPEAGQVRADPGQVEQCLLNLVVNARDAMPRGGTITVGIRRVRLEGPQALRQMELEPGEYVELSVRDTGCGIPPDVAERIFEPFYSTKGELGTGLGLATVYGVMKQSDGEVTVQSEPGQGAVFRLVFPRADIEESAGQPAAGSGWLGGSETVLLVEDEEMVRRLVRSVLQMQGYTVLEAADGEAALRVAAQCSGPIHLLLTDVLMPGGLSGRDVADRIAEWHPEARVLFMSGYTEDAVLRHRVGRDGSGFLQKPVSPLVLARKVREVLGRDP